MEGRELELVVEAFKSNYIAPAGPMLAAFEKAFSDYSHLPYAVALSSGTAAIHLAIKSLNLSPGDTIWASTLTFLGGVAPVIHERLRPVFVDSDPLSWTIDIGLLKENLKEASARGTLPKAVLTTDIYGQTCDMDELLKVCDYWSVPVISDSAEAVGALYKGRHAGLGAYAAAFSFNGNKIITTSGGGLLASSDRRLIDRARYLSTQARQPAAHYEHTEVGYNYRMSNISAAIGLGQLEVLEDRVRRRRSIFDLYRSVLSDVPGLTFMPEPADRRSTKWLTVIQLDPICSGTNREQVRKDLEHHNIEARPVWKPMHIQPVFAGSPRIGGGVAEKLFQEGLCLPSGSQMTDSDVMRVATLIKKSIRP
jgi:dTDP-4-amino-4,6-dideoxygalactose transaminase